MDEYLERKVRKYCVEARKKGYTARIKKVLELLSKPSHLWDATYSDTEIVIASRIKCEA